MSKESKLKHADVEQAIQRCYFADWLYTRSGHRLDTPEGERAWRQFSRGVLIRVNAKKASLTTPPKP